MKKIKIVLVGAGQRGTIYTNYALLHPHELEVVAFAEPNAEKRDSFSKLHGIPKEMCFQTWEELFSLPRLAEAALICTHDHMHLEPSIKALEKGYNILLEKPMSNKPEECVEISEYAKKYNRMVSICHVLRFTPFFVMLKKLIDEGQIGKLISIQHNENVGYWHQAHSYVRGNWRNSKESSPMILAKSCHDMDILVWLAGADCERLSSFGELTHFKKENAPVGAPQRCFDGCSYNEECPYYAPKLYITGNTGWPASVVSNDTSVSGLTRALKDGPYGRCVYHCDNDVVDHQVVTMTFNNGVTAAFTMCAFTNEVSRTIKLMGTRGEIRGMMEKNEIEVIDFASGTKNIITLQGSQSGHGGGDMGIMKNFVKLLQNDDASLGLTSAEISLQSHLMAFAAEKSRLEKQVIEIKGYYKSIKSGGSL